MFAKRNQTVRTPNGEIDKPCFFSSLATRSWTSGRLLTAASTSGATRFLRIGFLRLISCSASSPPYTAP